MRAATDHTAPMRQAAPHAHAPVPTDFVKPTPDESPNESNQSIPEDLDPAGSSEEMPVAQSLVESVRLEVEALRAMLGLSKNKKPDTPS